MRSKFTGLAAWLKNSFIDFPGTVSTVLFFSGCNLRCPYCHNPDFILCPEDRSDLSDQIWDFLEKRKDTVEGVVFSGGEPTLHADLALLMQEVRKIGYKAKLDTNGLLPQIIRRCSPDYLALDIKTVPALYTDFLKAPYKDIEERIGQSIAIVKKMGNDAEVRITVAPRIITREIISRLLPLLEGVAKVFLQPVSFRYEILDKDFFTDTEKIAKEELQQYQTMIRKTAGRCEIRDE